MEGKLAFLETASAEGLKALETELFTMFKSGLDRIDRRLEVKIDGTNRYVTLLEQEHQKKVLDQTTPDGDIEQHHHALHEEEHQH